MNLALRKLELLEKTFNEREESSRINGYCTNVIDVELKKNVSDLLNKIRVI